MNLDEQIEWVRRLAGWAVGEARDEPNEEASGEIAAFAITALQVMESLHRLQELEG